MEPVMIKSSSRGVVLLFCLSILFCLISSGYGQQALEPPQKVETVEKEPGPQKIVPAPQNPREKTGIFVFLAWVWLVILVLSYFLRLKIKELDRLYHLDFFPGTKDRNS